MPRPPIALVSIAVALFGVVSAGSAAGDEILASAILPELNGEAGVPAEPPDLLGELEERTLALAFPVLPQSNNLLEPQTSPRYAAHEKRELDGPWLAVAWAFAAPTDAERGALEEAAHLLESPESHLGRALLGRKLAARVRCRLFEHAASSVFLLTVEGTALAKTVDLAAMIDDALAHLATSGSSEARRAVARYLGRRTQNVVEFLPRNAPDPGLSVRSPEKPETRDAPPPARALPKARVHSVIRGDTLSGIARRYKTTVSALVRDNRIDAARPIRPGQKLVVRR